MGVCFFFVAFFVVSGCFGKVSGGVLKESVAQKQIIKYRWLGYISPGKLASIRARATGEVLRKHFRLGTRVAKGDTLLEIQNQASLASESAHRDAAKAAHKQLKRIQNLADKGHASAKVLEEAFVRSKKAEAEWVAMKDLREAAMLKAPFNGFIYADHITEGSTVASSNTKICEIASWYAPVISLTLSEQDADWISEKDKFIVREENGNTMPATLYAKSGVVHSETGGIPVRLKCQGSATGVFSATVLVLGERMSEKPVHVVDLPSLHFEKGQVGLLALKDGYAQFFPGEVVSITDEKVYLAGLPATLEYFAYGHGSLLDGEKIVDAQACS